MRSKFYRMSACGLVAGWQGSTVSENVKDTYLRGTAFQSMGCSNADREDQAKTMRGIEGYY